MKSQNISNLFQGKLAAYLASASAFILLHDPVDAQIIYDNISPDAELGDVNDFINLDLDENGDLDFAFGKASSTIPFTDDDYYLKLFLWGGAVGTGASIAGMKTISRYLPAALTYNAIIDDGLNFYNNPFQSLVFKTYLRTYYPYGSGLITIDKGGKWFPDVENHYLAIRFTADDAMLHYGWIRCTVENNSSQLVLKDFAYNAAPNQPIFAGVKTGTDNLNQTSNTISANIFSFKKEILIQSDQFSTVSVFDLTSELVVQTEITDQ